MKIRLSNAEAAQIDEWKQGIVPVFPDETKAIEQAGFVETDEECLCWKNGDYLIQRQTINGPGRKDMLRYFAYRQVYKTIEVDGQLKQVPVIGSYTLVDKPARQIRMVPDIEKGGTKEEGFIPEHPGHPTIQAAIALCV